VYYRAGDEMEEADFITRGVRETQRQQSDAMTAVLYRTNAQSRAIEDALMREGVAYRIIGGVRFYERKEIKDALAYLRLLINPHDDVSFRRVVNVPARGVGKSVMDALDAIDPGGPSNDAADTPLLLTGLQPAPSPRSLWARPSHGAGSPPACAARRGLAQGVPRPHRLAVGRGAWGQRVDCDRSDAGSDRVSPGSCARKRARKRRAGSRT
jgi:hypothetical protein